MNRKPVRLLLFICVFFFICLPNTGVLSEVEYKKRDGRYYEPVEVPGSILDSIKGKKIENLAVYAFRGGEWRPALFQVDELTPEGEFILPNGPESNSNKANGMFDNQDLIDFMARDAGEKVEAGNAPKGAESVVPVELINPDNQKSSWVYIVLFSGRAPSSGLQPISILLDKEDKFNFRFPTYGYDGLINRREGKPIPTIFINKLWVLPEAGGNGQNIIDRQKIRGEITFLGGTIKIPFNENLVSGGVVAYKPGPVRIITRSCMYPLFPMKIKGPKFHIESIMVDTLTLTTTTIQVPFDPGSLITEMKLYFCTDLTPMARGMRFYNSVNRGGFKIDGMMDQSELAFIKTKDHWRMVTGPQGTQIQFTKFDPKFLAKGEASSLYNDNEKDIHPPENYPGDIGAASDQIIVKGLPGGTYRINTFGCVPYDFYDAAGVDYKTLGKILAIEENPLIIKVKERRIENKGGKPGIRKTE